MADRLPTVENFSYVRDVVSVEFIQAGKISGQSTGPGAGSIMMQDAPQNPLPDPPHIDLLLAEKRVAHAQRVRLVTFALCNGLVFAAFAVLWAVEYKMPNPDKIDEIVVPWIWLICFFVASLCALGRPIVRSIWISIASAVLFSAVLLFFCQVILIPLFDPWF